MQGEIIQVLHRFSLWWPVKLQSLEVGSYLNCSPLPSLWVRGSPCLGKQTLAVFCAPILGQPVRDPHHPSQQGRFYAPIPPERSRVTQSTQDPYCTALHGLSPDTLQCTQISERTGDGGPESPCSPSSYLFLLLSSACKGSRTSTLSRVRTAVPASCVLASPPRYGPHSSSQDLCSTKESYFPVRLEALALHKGLSTPPQCGYNPQIQCPAIAMS